MRTRIAAQWDERPSGVALDHLAVGFLHKGSYERQVFSFLNTLEGKVGITCHDDLFGRHSEILSRAPKELWVVNSCSAVSAIEAMSLLSEAKRTSEKLSGVAEELPLPFRTTLKGLLGKLLAPYRVFRVSLHFLAARRQIEAVGAKQLIIPDERLPLARALAKWSERRSLPSISLSSDTDQIVRRVPLLETQHSGWMYLSSEDSARFLSKGVGSSRLRYGASAMISPKAGEKKGRVLFLSQGHSNTDDLLFALAAEVGRISSLRLRLRPHPVENRFLYRRRYQSLNQFCPVEISEGSLERDLSDSDLAVIYSSAAVYEAFASNVPVLHWTPGEMPRLLPLVEAGKVQVARSQEELSAIMNEHFASWNG